MDRRTFLSALLVTPAAAAFLAACGDPDAQPGSGDTTLPPGSTAPATTFPDTTQPGGITHPTGADDVLLRYGYEGGFVTPDTLFVRTPNVLITGAGAVITPGAVPAIFPGPLVMPFFVQTIDETGIQNVLVAAQQAGLLAAPPDYTLPDGIGIADAPDAVVALQADGGSFEHRAYALDITAADGNASTPARDALSGFITKLSDLESLAGADHLGPQESFVPTVYRVRATPVDPSQYGEPKPTVQPWPVDTGLRLADASQCVQADASKVGALFTASNQQSFFTEDGITYSLAVAAALPGDQAC
jgi:hypothetical protein